MSSESRLPKPKLDAITDPAGMEQKAEARVLASSAPVGVVRSMGAPRENIGSPRSRRAVAGAGTGRTPWAQVTVPDPTLRGEQSTRGQSRSSIRTKAPTMSTMESMAPTS